MRLDPPDQLPPELRRIDRRKQIRSAGGHNHRQRALVAVGPKNPERPETSRSHQPDMVTGPANATDGTERSGPLSSVDAFDVLKRYGLGNAGRFNHQNSWTESVAQPVVAERNQPENR